MGIVNDIIKIARKKWRSWGIIKKGLAVLVGFFIICIILSAVSPSSLSTSTSTTTPAPSQTVPTQIDSKSNETVNGHDAFLSAIANEYIKERPDSKITVDWYTTYDGTPNVHIVDNWHIANDPRLYVANLDIYKFQTINASKVQYNQDIKAFGHGEDSVGSDLGLYNMFSTVTGKAPTAWNQYPTHNEGDKNGTKVIEQLDNIEAVIYHPQNY